MQIGAKKVCMQSNTRGLAMLQFYVYKLYKKKLKVAPFGGAKIWFQKTTETCPQFQLVVRISYTLTK